MIALTVISTILFIIVRSSTKFADFFNYNLSAPIRQITAYLTTWISFSLAEILIIISPIWFGILIYFAVKNAKKGTMFDASDFLKWLQTQKKV